MTQSPCTIAFESLVAMTGPNEVRVLVCWGTSKVMTEQTSLRVDARVPRRRPGHYAPARPLPRRTNDALRVLTVESDPRAAKALLRTLQRHGYQAGNVQTGARALQKHENADLLLIDLDLPDLDGIELCRTIRTTCDVPIIVVTARDSEVDRVLSLRAGSDDYVAKPYSSTELMARIEAVMRRVLRQPETVRDVIDIGPLRIDSRAREIHLNGRPVKLTRKEFDLLHLLASRPGSVVTRRQIMMHVWRNQSEPGRTIDTHVSSLRSKLGSSNWIITARGVGFRFGHT